MDIFSPTILDNALITGSNDASLLQVSSPIAPSALFVSGSGRVGIGTGTPTNTLQVNGGITVTSITASTIGGLTAGQFTPYIRYNTDNIVASSSFGHTGAYMLSELGGVFGANDISFYAGAVTQLEIMRIVGSTGFVGIGESSPSAKLEIRGSGATSATTAFRVENSNASASLVVLDDGTSAFNTNHLYVSSSGRVGIGTTTPGERLHVAGNIRLDGTRYIDWGSGNSRITDLGFVSGQGYPIIISTFGPIAAGAPNTLTEKLRLTGSGSLGLGTTNPLSRLHISGSDGNDFLRITSGSQNILNIRSGSAVFFAGTGVAPTANFDLDVQGTGTAWGGSVRIAGNGTAWAFASVASVNRGPTIQSDMFNITMGGTSPTAIQNPMSITFNANQNPTSGSGYTVLRLNATHAPTAGTGSKLLQTWEFGGNAQSVIDISGSLGIGTGSTPNARLFVSGANNQSLLRVSSPSASAALFISGSGNVGIGTETPTGVIDVFQGGNSRILVKADDGFVGIQQPSPTERIHITSDPATSKYLRIDAAQATNPPPRYLPAVPAKEIYGQSADDFALGTPDYWMEIILNGNIVLIPCYLPN
jgi:hypothetical protein